MKTALTTAFAFAVSLAAPGAALAHTLPSSSYTTPVAAATNGDKTEKKEKKAKKDKKDQTKGSPKAAK